MIENFYLYFLMVVSEVVFVAVFLGSIWCKLCSIIFPSTFNHAFVIVLRVHRLWWLFSLSISFLDWIVAFFFYFLIWVTPNWPWNAEKPENLRNYKPKLWIERILLCSIKYAFVAYKYIYIYIYIRLKILKVLHIKTKKSKINRINFENSDNVLKFNIPHFLIIFYFRR